MTAWAGGSRAPGDVAIIQAYESGVLVIFAAGVAWCRSRVANGIASRLHRIAPHGERQVAFADRNFHINSGRRPYWRAPAPSGCGGKDRAIAHLAVSACLLAFCITSPRAPEHASRAVRAHRGCLGIPEFIRASRLLPVLAAAPARRLFSRCNLFINGIQ